VLLEHLHEHAGVAVLLLQELLREVEVGVGVVARAEAPDGEVEDRGIESFSCHVEPILAHGNR
jgi:hypothetical protein